MNRAHAFVLAVCVLLSAPATRADDLPVFLERARAFNHTWVGESGYAVFRTSEGDFQKQKAIILEDESAMIENGEALFLVSSKSFHRRDANLTPLYAEVRFVAYPFRVPKTPAESAQALFLERECRLGWNFLFDEENVTASLAETQGMPPAQVREMQKATTTPQPIGDHRPYTWGNAVLRLALHERPPDCWVLGEREARRLGPFQEGELEAEGGPIRCRVVQPDGNLAIYLSGGRAVRATLRAGGWQPLQPSDAAGVAEIRERLLRIAREAQERNG